MCTLSAHPVHKHIASVSNAGNLQRSSVEVLTENVSIENKAKILQTQCTARHTNNQHNISDITLFTHHIYSEQRACSTTVEYSFKSYVNLYSGVSDRSHFKAVRCTTATTGKNDAGVASVGRQP